MLFSKKNKYALCIGEKQSVFTSCSGEDAQSTVELLSSISHDSMDDLDAGGLLAGTGRDKGDVALVFPLQAFEIVNITVPPITRDGVARLLPFSLAKVLSEPVSDFIYDWQVAQQFKDRHELAVYLFPIGKYNLIKQALLTRQKEVLWFEPDVFSACSYLESVKHEALQRTAIVMLVWETSISIAVYENDSITLVRSVDIQVPEGNPEEEQIRISKILQELEAKEVEEEEEGREIEFSLGDDKDNEEVVFWDVVENDDETSNEVVEEETQVTKDPFESVESDNILAGFDLFHEEEDSPTVPPPPPSTHEDDKVPGMSTEGKWPGYIQNLILEVVRTSDYHSSVLKGKVVTDVFVGGAGEFFEDFEKATKDGQNFNLIEFPTNVIKAECDQKMAALSVGALFR